MHSYFDDDAATERTLVNGWLDTGDLGFLRYGQLFLTGRAKDVLILRGRNHPPHEVEQAVDGVAGLRTGCTAAVSYLAKAGDTEQLVLFVEHSSTATSADCEAMIDACMARVLETSGLSCDQVVVLAPGSLPRTSSGKIRRQVALQQWLAGDLRPPTSVGALQLAGAMLRSQMALNRSRRRER
jgi:acyl-CoA synthetase (AMP-forming)/AMP-acid ligase II